MSRPFGNIIGNFLMIFGIFGPVSNYLPARIEHEGDFVQIMLSISKYEKLSEGRTRFEVKNIIDGKKVGFILDLMPAWNPQNIDNTDITLYWGNAEIISAGEESNNFLDLLSRLYGLENSKHIFRLKMEAQVVGLANNPARVQSEPIKMKFFFNSNESEKFYSEVYINIDLKRTVLEFNEKDPIYREPLIKSLSQ